MDRSQPDAVASLHAWGWAERPIPPIPKRIFDPKTKKWKTVFMVPGEAGRPDLMCTRNGWGVHIEVKDGKPSFDFDQWEQKQRDWAEEWGFIHHLWFWLCLGIDAPTYNPEKYLPRQTYLFPYPVMLDIEAKIKPFQNTLPYRAKHASLELQERGLVAPVLLAPYRLNWKGKGIWELPPGHPFHIYNAQLPSLMGLSEKTANVVAHHPTTNP